MMIKEKPIIFSTPSIPAIQNLKPGTWLPEPRTVLNAPHVAGNNFRQASQLKSASIADTRI